MVKIILWSSFLNEDCGLSNPEIGLRVLADMFFVRSISMDGGSYEECCEKEDLIMIKVDTENVALVAFGSEELAARYFDFSGVRNEIELVDESGLAPDILEAISGDDLFLIEDEMMIEEMGRRGAAFPFSEFVRPYEPA
ncbi:MAG: hypothetical protein CMO55_12835 [Verrucomicrobiales bacterium]|nr:hypothetical protein [Verrucomicrobiales bacterium]